MLGRGMRRLCGGGALSGSIGSGVGGGTDLIYTNEKGGMET